MSLINKYEAVVIGTSAGGLFALSSLFEKIPFNYPLPIIVVQHRSKDQKDLLEEVLQTKCRIRVKQADEKEHIQKSTIYVAPPDYHLLIERDHIFSLNSDIPVNYSRPSIDVLFESAALAYRHQLVGIILTGANSDGAAGIAAIRKYGGLTIAQSPEDAQFPFMPKASIDTGQIELVLSLSAIKRFLLTLTDHTK